MEIKSKSDDVNGGNNNNGGKTDVNPQNTRNNPRHAIAITSAVLTLTGLVIIAVEVTNAVVQRDDGNGADKTNGSGFWVDKYGAENIGHEAWCEAIGSDHQKFIIESANARSDYPYIALGFFMIVMSFVDGYRIRNGSGGVARKMVAVPSSLLSPLDNSDKKGDNGGITRDETGRAQTTDGDAEQQTLGTEKSTGEGGEDSQIWDIPNGILSHPSISFANGLANVLHGLGSFWYHSCQCDPGGKADIAGMLAVVSFSVLYTPLQLTTGLLHYPDSTSDSDGDDGRPKKDKSCFYLGLLAHVPPVGQSILWVTTLVGWVPDEPIFLALLISSFAGTPVVLLYLYRVRNRTKRERTMRPTMAHNREELSSVPVVPVVQQRHSLKLWMYPLTLILFLLGFLAWSLDSKGVWCIDRNSWFFWFQGHVFWHLLTCGSLAFSYLIYRDESISRCYYLAPKTPDEFASE